VRGGLGELEFCVVIDVFRGAFTMLGQYTRCLGSTRVCGELGELEFCVVIDVLRGAYMMLGQYRAFTMLGQYRHTANTLAPS